MSVLLATRTIQEPAFCSSFLASDQCAISAMGRAPTTISASPRKIGATSAGMSSALYWLSASVLTMMSAPRWMLASSPAMNAHASPRFVRTRTTWSTPCARATATVPSVDPSSTTSHSTTSTPATARGSAASVTASVFSSL